MIVIIITMTPLTTAAAFVIRSNSAVGSSLFRNQAVSFQTTSQRRRPCCLEQHHFQLHPCLSANPRRHHNNNHHHHHHVWFLHSERKNQPSVDTEQYQEERQLLQQDEKSNQELSQNDLPKTFIELPNLFYVNNNPTNSNQNNGNNEQHLFPDSTAGIASLLHPIAQALQAATNGWALSYADLAPESETTLGGRLFLATNLAYVLAGLGVFFVMGNGSSFHNAATAMTTTATTTSINTLPLSLGLEVASVCSFVYHYQQLKNDQPRLVRLALLIDYLAAALAILIGSGYVIQDVLTVMTIMDSSTSSSLLEEYTTWFQIAVASGLISAICLLVSWIWERGWPYLVFHSLWHLWSAYTGYAVGMIHAMVMIMIMTNNSGAS